MNKNAVKLNTTPTGDGMQYYDQVCALSAEIINRNFVRLFATREEISEMVWFGANASDGQLKATMLPPQVELSMDFATDPEMLFLLRIDKGNIFWGKTTRQNLDGWVIAIPAKMTQMTVSVDPASQKDQEALDAAAAQLEEIEANIEFSFEKPTRLKPGEYSIHRLFAAIADSQWTAPRMDRSYMMDSKGQKVWLRDWMKDPRNNQMYSNVGDCLRKWAASESHKSFFTLGIQLRLPEAKVSKEKVSFAPRALRTQNYPYISEAKQKELITAKKDLVGEIGNPYNCFCYCEVVGNRWSLPGTPQLPFSGNLAFPKTTSNDEEVLGTFVLDHRHFLEQHLLPQLQELCVATNVLPLWPQMDIENNIPVFRTRFCSGSNPDDAADRENLPPQIATDPSFKFKRVGPQRYEWKPQPVEAPGSGQLKSYPPCGDYPLYRKYKTKASPSVTVTWKPGTAQFLVSGRCEYDHWEGYSRQSSNFPCPGFGQDIDGGGKYYWGDFTDIATWSFIIDLRVPAESVANPKTVNGVIEPKILECDFKFDPDTGLITTAVPKDLICEVNRWRYILDKTHERIRDAMKSSIGKGLGRVARNLANNFQGIGKFLYPGSGELLFGPPWINQFGNILATIEYLEPKASRVSWKPPTTGTNEPPTQQTGGEYLSDPSITKDTPHLAWTSYINSYDPVSQRLKLVIRGSNASIAPMAFKSVTPMFLRMKNMDHNRLYKANYDDWEEKVETKPEETQSGKDKKEVGTSPQGKKDEAEPKDLQSGVIKKEGTNPEAKKTADATIDVMKPAIPKQEPTKPASTETWTVRTDKIAQTLVVKPGMVDNEFEFNIVPKVLAVQKGVGLPDKFIVSPGGFLEVELSGKVATKNGNGIFVVQLNEIWASATRSPMFGRADAFFVIELKNGVIDQPPIRFVLVEEADKLRGVDTP